MDCTGCREAFDRFVEGSLDAPGRCELTGHVAACGGCRESMGWALAISSDLEALGESIVAGAPDIDLSAAVLAEIRRIKLVVPFRRPNRGTYWNWAAVATAAGLLFALSFWVFNAPVHAPGAAFVSPAKVAPSIPAGPSDETRMAGGESKDGGTGSVGIPPGRRRERPADRVAPANPPGPSEYTRENILAAMRESFDLSDGRERLDELARLSSEDAMELLADRDASPGAIIGASLGVEGPEVSEALYDVVGRQPEDAFARYRLARSYAANPDTQALADDQIDAMQALDPENAMGYYLKAQQFLASSPPNIKAALEALEAARALDTAGLYGDDAARSLAEAHIAAGVAPDVANLLGALTAGRWGYDEASGLAADLMAMAHEYQDAGDLRTAATIFESILAMGQQVDAGASYAQERLAGLDIQRAAMVALEPLYQLLSEPNRLQDLIDMTSDIATGIGEMEQYFADIGAFFAGDRPESLDDAFWSLFDDTVLNIGDLNIISVIRALLGN